MLWDCFPTGSRKISAGSAILSKPNIRVRSLRLIDPPNTLREARFLTPLLTPSNMNALAVLAVVLLIAWVVLKLALAVTSGLLHLLWIAAVVMFVIWIFSKLRGSRAP